jgi:large subunit ribosomal protein L9
VPRKLAIPTGAGAARLFVELAKQRDIANSKATTAAQAIADKYRGVAVEAHARVGEDGTLFGSIHLGDIAELLGKQGLVTDKKKIEVTEPIKTAAISSVNIKFHAGVEAPITVRVVPPS